MNHKLLAALLIVTTALTACGDKNEAMTGTGETIVSVNGVDLKESLIAPQLSQIPAQLMQGREAEIRQQLMGRIVEQEVARQEAERLNVMNSESYQNQLAAFESQLKTNMLMQQKLTETVTPEAVQGLYEKTKQNYAFPAVRARHILVKTEKEAHNIIKVATPANFAELAKEKSQGPSAPQGGDLGYFKKEAMVPAFADVAFNTAKGKIASKPVKTQFGWHVVFVEDKQDSYVPTLAQVENQLRQQLSQTTLQGYMKELKEKANIVFADTPEAEEVVEPAAGEEASAK